MTPVLRRLALLRHAEAAPTAVSDHDRELTSAGSEQAREAAAWLASLGFTPDHVLVSDARRTLATAAEVVAESGLDTAPGWDAVASLYEAGPETVLGLVQSVPADTRDLLVVGHNPTIAQLCQLLDDGTGDKTALDELAQGFPPASVALFEVSSDWLRCELFSARLQAARRGTGRG